jgi:hypothetical protein
VRVLLALLETGLLLLLLDLLVGDGALWPTVSVKNPDD